MYVGNLLCEERGKTCRFLAGSGGGVGNLCIRFNCFTGSSPSLSFPPLPRPANINFYSVYPHEKRRKKICVKYFPTPISTKKKVCFYQFPSKVLVVCCFEQGSRVVKLHSMTVIPMKSVSFDCRHSALPLPLNDCE